MNRIHDQARPERLADICTECGFEQALGGYCDICGSNWAGMPSDDPREEQDEVDQLLDDCLDLFQNMSDEELIQAYIEAMSDEDLAELEESVKDVRVRIRVENVCSSTPQEEWLEVDEDELARYAGDYRYAITKIIMDEKEEKE